MLGIVEDIPDAEPRRHSETIALISFTRSLDGQVDCDAQYRTAGSSRAFDQRANHCAVTLNIELEPEVASPVVRHLFNRAIRVGAKAVTYPGCCGGAGGCDIAI